MALLQENIGRECIRVHHRIQEDINNVGYLSQESTCTPQVYNGSTHPFVKESDDFKT